MERARDSKIFEVGFLEKLLPAVTVDGLLQNVDVSAFGQSGSATMDEEPDTAAPLPDRKLNAATVLPRICVPSGCAGIRRYKNVALACAIAPRLTA